MKNKILNLIVILSSLVIIVMPFAFNYSIDQKVLFCIVSISLMATLINDKRFKYPISLICLVGLLFVIFKWYF